MLPDGADSDGGGLDQALASSPPGARGVTVLPHLSGAAAPHWDPTARGAIVGLGHEHTPADLLRAMLEGVAVEAAANLARIDSLLGGGAIEEVRTGGGGALSASFNQLQADVYGTAVVPTATQASARGAAILGAVAIGAYPDATAAAAAMTQADRHGARRPDRSLQALYRELGLLHERTFRALAASRAA